MCWDAILNGLSDTTWSYVDSVIPETHVIAIWLGVLDLFNYDCSPYSYGCTYVTVLEFART
jgi:hypothetical protein